MGGCHGFSPSERCSTEFNNTRLGLMNRLKLYRHSILIIYVNFLHRAGGRMDTLFPSRLTDEGLKSIPNLVTVTLLN